jgi:sterol desaturase/sphingolipid hydroxylase (fatty acid hydroxylase superfamily)
VLAVALWLARQERCRPLRRRVQPGSRRIVRNLTVAATAAAAAGLVERPLVTTLSAWVEARRWGVMLLPMWPRWARPILTLLLLDYTLYVWHVLTHRLPFLWRFHLVHHLDRDLDVTTALRFHAGEMLLSLVFRSGQVLLIGVPRRILAAWQILTILSVMFHHSNLRLPLRLERRLLWLFVTPRMHGIHHSNVEAEADSNWSSGLSLWDRLHGTLRLDVPQEAITIGAPHVPANAHVNVARLMALPFKRFPGAHQGSPRLAS